MLLPLLLNILYSLTFVVGKVVLDFSQPIFFVAIRMIGSGVLSFLIYFYLHRNDEKLSFNITKKEWTLICFIGITNIYITNAFEFWGLQYLSAAKSAFIYNLTPFFAALISYFVFSEIMTKKKWIGLAIGFIGVMPLLTECSDIVDTSYKIGFLSLAEIALLAASIATALGWISIRFFVKRTRKLSPFLINGFSMIFGGLLCCLQSYCTELSPMIFNVSYTYATCVIGALIVTLVASYNLHSFLLKKYTATFLFFFGFTCPLITAILGFLFLGESITYRFVISAILVFVGLFVFYQEELKQGYIKY